MIPLFKMNLEPSDIDAINKVLKRRTYWAQGEEIEIFEDKIAHYLKVPYCVVFNSGTSALHAVMLAFNIHEGDEVIVPSFSFIATANAPLFVGAKPIFADIEDRTYGLDPTDVERKITNKTEAIICVHYAGCPCQINELKELAKSYNLILIEDAAEAMGADVNGIKVGTIGDAGVLSFCQNKINTTGEGGAVVTHSYVVAQNLKLIRSHGRENDSYTKLGYNWRMPSMNAALGISQLARIEKLIEKRRHIAEIYNQYLPKSLIRMPSLGNVYQMYSMRFPQRDGLIKYLAENCISSRINFEPIDQTQFYRNSVYNCHLPVTDEVASEILSLPMYPDLTAVEVREIANCVSDYYKKEVM